MRSFARRRETPTRIVEHAVASCPDCGTALRGGTVVRRRQVLHIPLAAVEVIEHVVRRRVCPHCRQVHPPPLDLSDQVLDQQRVSIATMAYIATLRTIGRLPLRGLQQLLAPRHGLRLSLGGLVGLLRAVAHRATPALVALRAAVRGSPVVHADETSWREEGTNSYVWFFGTPTLRYFHPAASRAGAVVTDVRGDPFAGTLVRDFSAAYTIHAGDHQRCWPHLLRDIGDLCAAHPADPALAAWAAAMHAFYHEAKQRAAVGGDEVTRLAARDALERRLVALCRPYWGPGSSAPQATRCQRVDRFLDELLTFVANPAVPPDNHLAERSLRPLVEVGPIARTI